MLEKNTECWICKRTEIEIIAEIKNRKWSESIFDEVREENNEDREKAKRSRTERGLISLVDVGSLGYSYPLCAFCEGLIYSIGDISSSDRINYEVEEGTFLTKDTIFRVDIETENK